MHANHKLTTIQQRRIQKQAQALSTYSFFNLLTNPELLSTVEDLLPAHRERKFPPTVTLSMFLSQTMSADRSCQNVVNELAVQRVTHGLASHSTHTGSYCKARQRLPLSMVSELVRCTGRLTDQVLPAHWRWQGRPVKLVDGTTATLPDTLENQQAYPQPGGQKPGLGFPICRIVGVISLAGGSILNAAMGPCRGKGTSEQTLLRSLLDTFEAGDIVLGDAYYAGYFFLAELIQRGVDGVFEQLGARKLSTDFRKGQKLGKTDHIICYKKPRKKPEWMTEAHYHAAPDTLMIRELKVGHKILVTTLLSPAEVSKPALKALYKDRWHVELDLRNIKTTLGMETFSCKTPQMVEKEMWVYFLAYNLIRIVMAQAASLADILPRQLSFKHTLQIWRAWRQQSSPTVDSESLQILLILIAENTVGHRPGRIEPRVVKRRPKAYPLLTKPRVQAREQVEKFGHPKKQK
jgi:hypothetical protein